MSRGHKDGYTMPLPEEELHLVNSVDSDKETDWQDELDKEYETVGGRGP